MITYAIRWERTEYDKISCFSTTDTDDFGNSSCVATVVVGDPTAYKLSEEAADQKIRIAVGNNIEFLSVNACIFVSEKPVGIEEAPVEL